MPVFEQGYRPYTGTITRRSPIPSMIWHNVRTRIRWYIWLLSAGLMAYPYVVFGVMVFLFTAGQALFGMGLPGTAGGLPETAVAFDAARGMDPGRMLAMLTATTAKGALPLYWNVMHQASFAALVLPAVACGGILASDRTTGAMQIYFARPVTRFQYMVSKVLSVALFTALVTAVPTLAIWLETVAFSPDPLFIVRTWMAPFAIIAASAFYGLWSASVILTLSTLLKRPVLTSIGAIFLYLLLSMLGEQVSRGVGDKMWRILSPHYAIGGFTAPLFGMDLPEWLNTPWLAVPALIVPLALLAFVWSRVRAVEVTT